MVPFKGAPMSQIPTPSMPGYQQVVVVNRSSNGMGIAGFVVSLLGLLGGCFGGFLLSPLGLIFSIIGMRRPPKGLAIAGLVMGIIGSLWLAIAVIFMGGLAAAAGGGAFAMAKDGMAMVRVKTNVQSFYATKQRLPADMTELVAAYPDTPTADRNGTPLQVDFTPPNICTIKLSGFDGKIGTADDMTDTFSVK